MMKDKPPDQFLEFLHQIRACTDRLKEDSRASRRRMARLSDGEQHPASELERLAASLLAMEKRLALLGEISGGGIRNNGIDPEAFRLFMAEVEAVLSRPSAEPDSADPYPPAEGKPPPRQ